MSIPMSAPSLQADEPCDLFMAGLTFHHAPVAGKDAADVQEYVKAMQRAGAVVTPTTTRASRTSSSPRPAPRGPRTRRCTRRRDARSPVVSWFWIQECLKANELVFVERQRAVPPPALAGGPARQGAT